MSNHDETANAPASGDDKRRYARIKPSILIEVKSESDIQGFVAAYVHDISLGGIFIKTPHPRPLGDKVHFRFPYNQDRNVCELTAKVVRVIGPEEISSAQPVAGMGLEFAFTGETARQLLKTIVVEYKALKQGASRVVVNLE